MNKKLRVFTPDLSVQYQDTYPVNLYVLEYGTPVDNLRVGVMTDRTAGQFLAKSFRWLVGTRRIRHLEDTFRVLVGYTLLGFLRDQDGCRTDPLAN